jgi:hypothetical protein
MTLHGHRASGIRTGSDLRKGSFLKAEGHRIDAGPDHQR